MPWNLFIRGCGEDTRFVVGEAESKRERERERTMDLTMHLYVVANAL
jgi:hypothetical protein